MPALGNAELISLGSAHVSVGLAAAKPEAFREDGFAADMKKHLNYSINVINIHAS